MMIQELKSKTINFSMALAVLGVVEINLHLIQDQLGDKYGAILIVISAVVAVLRAVTTKPLSEK